MEELECNPFYLALQGKFKKEFEIASLDGALICVPCVNSLQNVEISHDLIRTHIMKPSPYFKGQYVSSSSENDWVVELGDKGIIKLSGFKDMSNIEILEEELGYNKKGKSFRIFIIEKPLDVVKQIVEKHTNKIRLPQDWLEGTAPVTLAGCKKAIEDIRDGKVINNLDIRVMIFTRNYILLPQYCGDAGNKLKMIIDSVHEDILQEDQVLDVRTNAAIRTAIEGYVMHNVHPKLFPVICQRYKDEDRFLSEKLLELHQLDVTASQLGADDLFSCHLPATIVELATLDTLTCPREKIQCLKNVIDLIMAEVKQNLQETQCVLTPPGGLPSLTSDDLIPVLLTAIVGAKLQHFASNLFYIENFLWTISSKDAHSYSLVTFKAVMEFLKTLDITLLKPHTDNMKKELSLEELIQVTENLQVKTISSQDDDSNIQWTAVDRQMERIAKMIEASTKELSSVQHYGVKPV